MATKENGDGFEVADDGEVDTKVKTRIINARQRVDDREDYLYVKAPVEQNLSVNQAEQDVYWGMIVKQFLRTIGPILRAEDLGDLAEKYREGVNLGSVELVPRNTEAVPFEQYVRSDIPDVQFKLRHGIPESVQMPEPVAREFVGLQSILETDPVLSETWVIHDHNGDPVQTRDERPVPKHIYERAVTAADDFLQQVGIGAEIEKSGSDIIRNFDMSGEEPRAEYGTGEYDSNPNI
jgi:hypothetical protein